MGREVGTMIQKDGGDRLDFARSHIRQWDSPIERLYPMIGVDPDS